MKILITGFEPFGNDDRNASWKAITTLPHTIQGVHMVTLLLPVSMDTSLSILHDKIQMEDPDVILSIGQAKGREAISVERVGINVDDFRICDNDGNQVHDLAIFADGPDAYFSNLPITAMVEHIKEKGIKAEISNTAGTYICNHILYGVRYMIEHEFPHKKSGFIHVPCLEEQVCGNTPFMELEDMCNGLIAAIETIRDEWNQEH